MSREPTWLEAATVILESSNEPWMTAPDLVRSIMRTEIRALRSSYGQAVRTLRSALNLESRKINGQFSRKEYNFNCYFALNKILEESKPVTVNSQKIGRSSATKTPRRKRKSVSHTNTTAKVSTKVASPEQVVCNGFLSPPPSPSPTPVYSRMSPLTVEIDPLFKPPLTQVQSSKPTGYFCLPSPLTSLVGPKRTLQVLNESNPVTSSIRPVREVRKRRPIKYQDGEPDTVIIDEQPCNIPSLPEILRIEFCHSLPSYHFQVSCVRCEPDITSDNTLPFQDDPCSAQGDRISSGCCEIDPNYVYKEDSSDLTSDFSSSEIDSEQDDESVRLQPTPSSQLFVRRTNKRKPARFNNSQSEGNSESELTETSPAGSPIPNLSEHQFTTNAEPLSQMKAPIGRPPRTSVSSSFRKPPGSSVAASRQASIGNINRCNKSLEPRRHVSTLFQPCSPLLSENLKSLLSMESFDDLSEVQKKKLLLHLPSIDQQNGTRIPSDCLTNSFYSSALREWSERVAVGIYTPEYKAKVRGEEKRKLSLKPDNYWKEKYYEKHYGDGVKEDPEPPSSQPYYPFSQPSSSSSTTDSLTTIINGYFQRDVDPPATKNKDSPPSSPLQISPSPVLPNPPTKTPSTAQTIPFSSPKPKESKTLKKAKNPVGKRFKTTATVVSSPEKSQKPVSLEPSQFIKENTVVKKLSSPAMATQKASLSALLSGKNMRLTSKKTGVKRLTSHALVQKLLSQSSVKAEAPSVSPTPRSYLTRLPPRMSYQVILSNLIQASASNPTSTPTEMQPIRTHTQSSVEHKHSVFHDHFALFGPEHTPSEFANRMVSLPMSYPLEVYNICMQNRAIRNEHSYAGTFNPLQPNVSHSSLTLSVPRALLRTKASCVCDKLPLVFCAYCRSLYHSSCTGTNLCPTCSPRN